MDVNTKYRRWGWGAVIALIGVILIAGLIVAVSMSSPKPDNSIAKTTAASEEGEGSNAESDADAEARAEAERKAEEEAKQKEEAEKKAAEEKAAAEKKAAEEKAAREKAAKEEAAKKSNLPHTGPTDSIAAIIGFAVIAYLFALNVSLVKKQTH
ncbi:MAG: hypothetical protein K6F57_03920 [Candidatus Saccharibacteria bacterium]|nr:hypothetical protein [Candidatus Saccharibacteria bacterium]